MANHPSRHDDGEPRGVERAPAQRHVVGEIGTLADVDHDPDRPHHLGVEVAEPGAGGGQVTQLVHQARVGDRGPHPQQAAVVIEDGRIVSATIARCLTRYSCSVIAALPAQVAVRQSPDVDSVSGATQSANAFYYAVVEALSKAK